MNLLPNQFFTELKSSEEAEYESKSAVKTQRILNGIEAQKAVCGILAETWNDILSRGKGKGLYSPKEVGILQIAAQIPNKIPTEKQAFVLLDILEKARIEAIYVR